MINFLSNTLRNALFCDIFDKVIKILGKTLDFFKKIAKTWGT
jgi:hypothetical protein